MKSETAESDRNKVESRQSVHRRKMSKNASIVVNGGVSEGGISSCYAAEDESAVVRQINLAAAFHDHISCTKSAELCKIDGSREPRVSLPPCETDHIYANCSETRVTKSPPQQQSVNSPASPTTAKLTLENKRLRNMLVIQLELIKQLEHELMVKNRLVKKRKRESTDSSLRSHLDRKDRMSLLRNHHKSEEDSTDTNISKVKGDDSEATISTSTVTSTTSENSVFAVPVATPVANEHSGSIPTVNLVTRYFGRRSKTIPSRALKRRYLGPPKSIPFKKPAPVSVSSATSVSSESEVQEDEMVPKAEVPKESKPSRAKSSLIDIKRISKKRGKRPKGMSRKTDFLTTDKAYFLPDNQTSQSSLVCNETLIDVPSWKLKPVTSFYQMEGTENINDPVFQRRHLKCEQDERRRKRWDIQRLREQKVSEKLKYKYCRDEGKESENNVKQKSQSFYPDPRHIQYIEVTDQLPVLAFGHLIPLFQPSEFSISWKCDESPEMEPTEPSPTRVAKKSRLSITGPKVT